MDITIKNDGVPFNPLKVPPPDLNKELDQMEPGGLGIHLVRNVILCSMQDHVHEVFEIAGFTSIFEIYADHEAALESF